MMTRRPYLLIPALLALVACGDSQAPQTEAGANGSSDVGVTATEILIGSHTDLSGPIAIWGVGATNGARMRIDEVNKNGGVHGRQIRFIVEDSQYQVPQAIRAANKLIHRDKVFAILLAAGTPMNNAVMETQFREGVPNLFPLTAARSMVTPFRKLMVTQMGIYYDEIRAAVRHFIESEGKSTPCVIYQDTDYGQEILEGAQDQAAAMGIEIAATSAHKPTESEFTAAILRLRSAGCDLVLMGTVHRDTILVLEAARKNGWEDVAWVGNEAAYGQVIADQESGSGEGYYAFVPLALLYEDDEMAPAVRAWYEGYQNEFGASPGLPAMVGYRGADLTVKALEAAGADLTREGLIAAVEAMSEYTDIFGYTLTFGPEDHKGVDGSVLSQIQDGRWVTLGTSISY
tara:strand:+ start:116 stop:1321 length:1206 start_codon:yes stop_codon:yes gene_type:complete